MESSLSDPKNLIHVVKNYIDCMLNEVSGRKALVLDDYTLSIVSIAYSRSEILQKEVFLIEKLDNLSPEKLLYLKGIYFLRGDEANIRKLS